MLRFKLFLFSLSLFAAFSSYAQMDFRDSSVQVIAYWDLGETYEYEMSLEKIVYNQEDTLSRELMTYDVEITVIDSTENSYTVRWFYKNFKSDSDNPVMQRIASAAEDIAVDIKTDELGIILGVENWEEVRDYMTKSFDNIREEFAASAELDRIFTQLKNVYSSRVSIEGAAIQDAQQFHNFHGGHFVLNETIMGQLQTPNVYYNDQPFDTEVSIKLEAMDIENNDYIIRSIQEIDPEQLADATYSYLKELVGGDTRILGAREDFANVSTVVEIVSDIHNTGWVLESVSWKEVVADGVTNEEIRRIILK